MPVKQNQLDFFAEEAEEQVVDWKSAIPELQEMSGKNLKWMYSVDYRLADTKEKLQDMVDYMSKYEYVAVDTETTGLEFDCKTVMIQMAVEPGVSYCIPLRMQSMRNVTSQEFIEVVGPYLKDPKTTIVAFNWKFDGHRMDNLNALYKGLFLFGDDKKIIDLQIVHKLQDPDRLLGLKKLTQEQLGLDQLELEDLFKRTSAKKATIAFQSLPAKYAIPYAAADSDFTLRHYLEHKDWVDNEMETNFICKLEHKIQKIVARMEQRGVFLDIDLLKAASKLAEAEIDALYKEIEDFAGKGFQVNSVKQLGDLLYGKLGLTPLQFTDKGAPAVGKDALEPYKETVPEVGKILMYKEACKLKTAFLDKLPEYADYTQSVHCNFNHIGANSGRYTCTDPNLQQLPKKGRGSGLKFRDTTRQAFQPRLVRDANGKVTKETLRQCSIFVDSDYSQAEYRLTASFCRAYEPSLADAYERGLDFHQFTAASIFSVPYEKVTKNQRKTAKEVSFGLLYGLSTNGLAQNLNISNAEAERIMEDYFSSKPGIKTWKEAMEKDALKNGYIKTFFGRKRFIHELKSKDRATFAAGKRKIVNSTIQGTSADVLKLAQVQLDKLCARKYPNSSAELLIHDEMVVELSFKDCPEDMPLGQFVKTFCNELRECMEMRDFCKKHNWVTMRTEPALGATLGDLYETLDGQSYNEETGELVDIESDEVDWDNFEDWYIDKINKQDANLAAFGEYIKDVKPKIEEVTRLKFILPEKMPEIRTVKFKSLIKENPGDTEFDMQVGEGGQVKTAKSRIALSSELVKTMEALGITVKIPQDLLFSL